MVLVPEARSTTPKVWENWNMVSTYSTPVTPFDLLPVCKTGDGRFIELKQAKEELTEPSLTSVLGGLSVRLTTSNVAVGLEVMVGERKTVPPDSRTWYKKYQSSVITGYNSNNI